MFRLHVVRPTGMNVLLQFLPRYTKIILGLLIFLIERFRDDVHPHIGALRRQSGGHEQIQRRAPVQECLGWIV